MVQTLALLGGSAPSWVIEHVAGEAPWTDRDLSVWTTESHGLIELRNRALADLVTASETPSTRAAVLRSAVDTIASRPAPQEPAIRVCEIAAQRLHELGEAEAAHHAYVTAGDAHLQQARFEESIPLLHRALDTIAQVPDRNLVRFELCTAWSQALAKAGCLAAADEIVQRELSREVPVLSLDQQAVLLSIQAEIASRSGDAQRSRYLLAEARGLVAGSTSELVDVVDRAALERAFSDADVAAVQALSDRLQVRALEHDEIDPVALLGQAMTRFDDGSIAEANEAAATSYALARRAGDVTTASRALYALGMIEGTAAGPNQTAIEYLGRALVLARTRSNSGGIVRIGSGMAVFQLESGRVREARHTVDSLRELPQSPAVELDLHQVRVLVALCEGDLDQAAASLDEADPIAATLDSPHETGLQLRLRAEHRRRTGETDLAVDLAQRGAKWLLDCGHEALRREAILETVRCHRAAGVIPLSVIEDWVPLIGIDGRANQAWTAACHAIAGANPLDLLEAADLMDAAHHHYEAMSLRLDALEHMGTERLLAQELRAEAERAGATWIANRAAAVLETVDGSTRASGGTRRPGPLAAITDRQAEVLRCVAQGKTNQEIADELFVSARTVSTHLTRLFRTLGVRNRAEAIVAWREADAASDR